MSKATLERLHECKRGLSVASSRDYNDWWRQYGKALDRITELEIRVGELLRNTMEEDYA